VTWGIIPLGTMRSEEIMIRRMRGGEVSRMRGEEIGIMKGEQISWLASRE